MNSKRLIYILFALLILMVASPFATKAHAQAPLKMLTGEPSGTYFDMAAQLLTLCKTTQVVAVEPSSGSVANVDAVFTDNTAAFSITQIEALYALKVDPSVVQVLFSLHPEQVHLIVSTTPRKIPTGRFSKLIGGGDPLVINSSSDVMRFKIGAWGGSVVTSGILNEKLELASEIIEFDTSDGALAALQKNHIDAVIYVAGTGNKLVAGLDMGSFRLIPFSDADISKLTTMFSKDRLTYTRLRVRDLPTISTQSVVIMRAPKKGAIFDTAKDLQNCFYEKLETLQSTPNLRANWAFVKKPGDEGYVTPKWKVWSPGAVVAKTK